MLKETISSSYRLRKPLKKYPKTCMIQRSACKTGHMSKWTKVGDFFLKTYDWLISELTFPFEKMLKGCVEEKLLPLETWERIKSEVLKAICHIDEIYEKRK